MANSTQTVLSICRHVFETTLKDNHSAKPNLLSHSVVCTSKVPQTLNGWSNAAFTLMKTRIRWWSTSLTWVSSTRMSFLAAPTGWSSLLSLTGAAGNYKLVYLCFSSVGPFMYNYNSDVISYRSYNYKLCPEQNAKVQEKD